MLMNERGSRLFLNYDFYEAEFGNRGSLKLFPLSSKPTLKGGPVTGGK